jgi:uncharacterized protein YydD (DUF2326 family)
LFKILKLYSDNPDFRTIEFNESGFTFILAKHKLEKKGDDKDSFNGVGKSLSIALIHFCLGAKKNTAFNVLDNWTFCLDIKINDNLYTIKRNTSVQEIIFIDDEEFSINKFNAKMFSILFDDLSINGLKFRSLLSRFIRPSKKSYISYDKPVSEEAPYIALVNNGYILGFNEELIEKKYLLKQEFDSLDERRKKFEKDDIIKEFFLKDGSKKDIKRYLRELESEIEKKELQKKHFKIAENYSDIVAETKKIRLEIKELEHKLFLNKEILQNIEDNLKLGTELSANKLLKVFDEAKISFGEENIKSLKEVEEFHKKLSRTRNKRLKDEQKNLLENEKNIKGKITDLQIEFNKKSMFIKSYGAIEEYDNLQEVIFSLKKRYQKLDTYHKIFQKYDKEISRIKINFEEENIKSDTYIDEKEELIKSNHNFFKSLIESFYNDKTGSIGILTNKGENTIRFDLDVTVTDDSSDGVNSVKIFSFDVLGLKNYSHHKFGFIFHDSRLFYNIDETQIRFMFKFLLKFINENNLQYICSLNENQFNSLKDCFEKNEDIDDFNKIFRFEKENKTVTLELSDESDKTKILGNKYEIKYDTY